jgi:hypothetical protein
MNCKTLLNRKSKLIYLLMIAFTLVSTSCSVDGIDGNANAKISEKINLISTGEINQTFNLESAELIDFQPASVPYVNDGEYNITLNLGNNTFLKLWIYDANLANPLEAVIPFPSYTYDLIQTRSAYVIADYIVNGESEYSTISTLINNIERTNVVTVKESESFYQLFLEDLILHNTSKEGHSAQLVSVNFTGSLYFNK